MKSIEQTFQYYWIRFTASRERDLESGEVSATTVVMGIKDKANRLNLG